ncbi:MAG: MEKHLA domain-containing protein, partial [Gallionella sp.]|nr:MEKHLA domain-containing protein [Gallionella sp.]
AQEARVRLLEKVSQQGYVDGYSGMRIAKSGRRFMITDTTVWNLLDEAGEYHGQAAVFVSRPD